MIISWLGIIIILFGVMSLLTIYKTDEDELPAPKEHLYKSGFLIVLVGLLVYESGKLGMRLSDSYNHPVQNNNKILK